MWARLLLYPLFMVVLDLFFFSPAVIDYLFGGISAVKVTIDDVPDVTLQDRIRKLAGVESTEEFHDLLSSSEYEFRYTCGVAKPSSKVSLNEKPKIINAMCLHFAILVSLAELEQLRRGFSMLKFSSLMEVYPDVLRKAFEPPEIKVSSDYIQDLFKPILSPNGSNKRATEGGIMMNWIHYLQKLDGTYYNVDFVVLLLL